VTSSNVFLFYLDLGQRCLEIQRQESLELRVLDGKFYKGSEEGSQTGRRVSLAKKCYIEGNLINAQVIKI
jgi:hypothetical protein